MIAFSGVAACTRRIPSATVSAPWPVSPVTAIRRTPLRGVSERTGRRRRSGVMCTIILMSRAAVVLTLLLASFEIAQEVPVTGVQYGPAPFQRQSPQMASDGTNFLVAWRDARAGN